MNTKIIIIVALLAGLIFGSFVAGKKQISPKEVTQQQVQTSLDPQLNSEGSVEVEVTPIEISASSDSWKFKIALNTHSVELNQDLTKAVLLLDNKGNEYQPLSWDGAPPGGHHREGEVTFRPISPQPSSIELIVKDIDGVPERKFNWDLKQ